MGGRTVFPSGYEHRSQAFTASGNFSVPSLVQAQTVFVSGNGPGGGGCSGGAGITSAPNDYSTGGSGGQQCIRVPLKVVPGETLWVQIGAAGTGGAGVTRSTAGTTNGNDGSDGSVVNITRSSVEIFRLRAGKGGTWATAGGGAGAVIGAAAGVTDGGDGGDDTAGPESVGTQPSGTNGTDDGGAYGGYAGGASGAGNGGDGGDGDQIGTGTATGTAGATGGLGGGGGGGGSAYCTGSGTANSGDGGDGGAAFVLIEWWEAAS